MGELLGCPLCGNAVTAIETHPGRGELRCGKCDLVLGGNDAMTPDELTERWNDRPYEGKLREMIAERNELIQDMWRFGFSSASGANSISEHVAVENELRDRMAALGLEAG